MAALGVMGCILEASMRFQAARSAFERARRIVSGKTRAFGVSIWREGHPSDVEDFLEFQRWAFRYRAARRDLAVAFAVAPPEGFA